MQSICSLNDNFTNKYNELNNALGKTNDALNEVKNALPYFSDFTRKQKVSDKSYTATEDCAIYVYTVTKNEAYGSIVTKINNTFVRQHQNPTAVANIVDAFTIFARKGDVISVTGAQTYSLTVYA